MANPASSAPVTAPTQASPATARNGSRMRVMGMILLVFVLIAAGYGTYWFLVLRHHQETDDAYVQGNVVQITPQVQGTVSRILVDDTMLVKAGQPLLTFDSRDADLAVAQAESQLAQTVREVRTLFSSHKQSDANLSLRVAEFARAQDDYQRRKALLSTGAVSNEELRHAEMAVGVAQAAVNAAREQLSAGSALISGTDVQRHPNVVKAATVLREALLAQERMTVVAPVAGQIAKRSVQLGQRVAPGAPLMAVIPTSQLWVDANFKESQLRNVRIGQPVTLVTDLYGSNVVYHGRVAGLAAGTGSAFALLPAQNATGNWIKVVQRLPVRITLDEKELAAHPLRIGLSVTATVDVSDQHGQLLSDAAPPSVAAVAASGESANADARVAAIIQANLR